MTAACLLAKNGLRVTLVEAGAPHSWNPEQTPSRVSALNLASQNILKETGAWSAIIESRATPYRHMQVWDDSSEAAIRFDAEQWALPSLGYIVENALVVQAMREKLEHNYNVTMLFNSELLAIENDDRGFSATIRNTTGDISLEADLAVAADGANSMLRRLANIPVVVEEFDQEAIVTTVDCELPHQETAWQCFTPYGPVALLPLHGDQCSLVYSCNRSEVSSYLKKNSEHLQDYLTELFGHKLGEITIKNPVRTFPLTSQHAETYLNRRIALVGDAAHTTHPLAGLGANIGLLDIAALCELVAQAHSAGRSISGHSLLRRYERWRRGENAMVLSAMKTFKTVFGTNDPMATRLRETGFQTANRLTPLKTWLVDYAIGLSGDLPKICKDPSTRH